MVKGVLDEIKPHVLINIIDSGIPMPQGWGKSQEKMLLGDLYTVIFILSKCRRLERGEVWSLRRCG